MPIPDISAAIYKGFRTGMVDRSFGARASDVYNVKDFGAIGFNTAADDGPKIQLAVNAALSTTDSIGNPKIPGGIIYFPSGTYVIQTPVVVSGTSDAGLVFMGSGSNQVATGGTKLYSTTLNTDYLLRIEHSSDNDPHRPVSMIMGIGFTNTAMPVGGSKVNFTTTEPTGAAGGGFGCLYIGSAAPVFTIYNCSIVANNSIGIFSAAPMTSMTTTYVTNNFVQGQSGNPSDPPLSSFGVIGRNIRVTDCRVHTSAVALNAFHGSFVIENMNLEVSGSGAIVGENLIAYWEPSDSTVDGDGLGGGKVRAASTNALFNPIPFGSISGMAIESIGPSVAFKITAADNLVINGVGGGHFHSTDASPPYTQDLAYGMWIGQVTNSKFSGVNWSGKVINTMVIGRTHTMGFGVTSAGHGGNIIMDSCSAGSTTGTNLWTLPPGSWYSSAGADPILFQNCKQEFILGTGVSGQDGGVLIADLPPTPTVTSTHPVVVTDAVDDAWTGTASNVGKPVGTGTGNPATGKRRLVRYDKPNSTWRIAG